MTQYDRAEVFSAAYSQVANIEKGFKGFRAAGIYPLNLLKCTDDDNNLGVELEDEAMSESYW